MSFGFAYVQRSIDAAVRLALRDTQALSMFDMTADGFYHSFAAMIVGLPLYIGFLSGWHDMVISLAAAAGHPLDAAELEFGARDFALSAIRYLLLWTVFPIAILFVLRFLNMTGRYSALVIAYNWSAIIVMLLFNVPLALFGLGVTSPFATVALLFTIFGFALYYRFFVAVAALQAGASTAMAVAVINVMIFFFIVIGIDSLGEILSA